MQKIVTDRLRPSGRSDVEGVEQAKHALRQAYAVAEGRLEDREWVGGDAFSMADCAAAPALFYADIALPFSADFPNMKAYFERLLGRPSFARVLREARPYFHLFPLKDQMPRAFPRRDTVSPRASLSPIRGAEPRRSSNGRAGAPVSRARPIPRRLGMVERLSRGSASVKELAEPLAMALPSVMKHLRVMERGGLVRSKKTGRVSRLPAPASCPLRDRRLDRRAARRPERAVRSAWTNFSQKKATNRDHEPAALAPRPTRASSSNAASRPRPRACSPPGPTRSRSDAGRAVTKTWGRSSTRWISGWTGPRSAA